MATPIKGDGDSRCRTAPKTTFEGCSRYPNVITVPSPYVRLTKITLMDHQFPFFGTYDLAPTAAAAGLPGS
jgi:hypothetical protein